MADGITSEFLIAMKTTLTIKQLKNIQSLVFEIPPKGAYLLAGTNGAGKTSLLTCLSRLRNSNAFQIGFRSSAHPSLDSHRGASVNYAFNNESVTYTYVEERWAPLPRKNAKLLDKCGYPEVAYIAADADRVQPQKQEFSPRKVRLTDQELRNAMNKIFSTERFTELCYVNVKHSGVTKAHLIRQDSGRAVKYFSERNFSLGELCVLKLLLALRTVANGSLVLIDELELGTHPRAQTELFTYISKFANDKNLTVIFSTHSVSLIKNTDRRQVLLLESVNGEVRCTRGCYPTYTLGHVASGEEVAPDHVLYVEDDSACKCVEAMLEAYKIKRGVGAVLPTMVVMPIGGFRQILTFLDRAPQMLPSQTRITALLDADVKEESLVQYQADNNFPELLLFDNVKNQIKYLPWTPEVGLVKLILANRNDHEKKLKAYFSDNRFVLPTSWAAEIAGKTGRELRDGCKSAVFKLGEHVGKLLGKPNGRCREILFKYLVVESDKVDESMVRLIGSLI
jgi:ABC-type branched-subunit amino acid transport system ATPase component